MICLEDVESIPGPTGMNEPELQNAFNITTIVNTS